jgi:hypothetical protein
VPAHKYRHRPDISTGIFKTKACFVKNYRLGVGLSAIFAVFILSGDFSGYPSSKEGFVLQE